MAETQTPISINATNQLPLKLTSKNYSSWRAQFDALLYGFDLAGYVDGTIKAPAKKIQKDGITIANPKYSFWLRQDKLILHAIIASSSEAVLPYVASSATSHDAWQKLLKLFANKTRSRIMDLKSSLTSTKRNASSVAEYFQKMKQIIDELHLTGTVIEEDDQVLYILNGLGPEFREISTAIRARETPISLEELHDKLVSFESLLRQEADSYNVQISTANLARRGPNRNFQQSNRRFNKPSNGGNYQRGSVSSYPNKITCQICDKLGHSARQCRQGGSFFSSRPSANYASIASFGKAWCLDSGASDHVTADLKNLSISTEYDGTEAIQIGDGSGLNITHKGDTKIVTPDHSFKLQEVLCVPQMTQNLVSVSKFCKSNDVSVEFDADKFLVKDLQTRAPMLRRLNEDDLYYFPSKSLQIKPVVMSAVRVSAQNWHQRLGHSSKLILNRTIKDFSLPVLPNEFFPCNSCNCNKSHKKPFGISHLQTPPYTSEHNGFAERRHRHVIKTGLTLLHQASLPLEFWSYAFQTAVYLINRMPSPNLKFQSAFQGMEESFTPTPAPDLEVTRAPLNTSLEAQTNDTSAETIPEPVVQQESETNESGANNNHPMMTRLKNQISKPNPRYFLATKHPVIDSEPTCVSQAIKNPNWRLAMNDEINALIQNGTWCLVPPSPNQNIVGCKWIYRIKRNPDNSISKYKARLVAKGFHQRPGIDFSETFSPDVKPTTIRIVLSLAIQFNWELLQLDVNNAFLHGTLLEDVFMKQPPGFIDSTHPDYVCKLQKSIYGLKQAPRTWYTALSSFLIEVGFHQSKSDSSLFIYTANDVLAYFLVYVDDIILTGNSKFFLDEFIGALSKKFSLKDPISLSYFLGIETIQTAKGLLLSQKKYMKNLLERSKMLESKPVTTPMATSAASLTLEMGNKLSDASEYRSIIGALQYLSLTRPDISFSVNKLAQFMHQPTEVYWQTLKRILRYLKGTLDTGLLLSNSDSNSKHFMDLKSYADADWAGDTSDRKSTQHFLVYLNGNLISWNCNKQKSVARSSTEAEYKAIASAAAELAWIENLLSELKVKISTSPTIYSDNIGATYVSANPALHSKMKHIAIDFHFVRDKVQAGALQVQHVSTHDQLADLLTKPLSKQKFQLLSSKIGVSSSSTPS
ncbi:hypothetical protein CCACVL1_22657 [Corchorus capsularis]|uniref:Integrase, catalytic core n=1 Tax=Corchorus capsularis TaxID=210143 RepID=A0A1R3GXM5_COCAP|nr:hypothetical protein CCACVL1_22657 [Corchorus capsularis]